MQMPIRRVFLATILSIAAGAAAAVSLADLSNADASNGLKAALDKGATAAVAKLGVNDGFLNNEKVRIGLPDLLEKARPILKMTGQGKQLDDLVVSMNHAAEAAVPMAKPLLLDAVKSMSVTDAKGILTGGETSVTEFFKGKTSAQLAAKFLPIVKGVTDRSGLSAKYNGAMSQVSKLGLSKNDATVEQYVTQRALDGLYATIAEEEKALRQNPMSAGSNLIGKVFGALK
jgi:hypothetical protein